MRETLLSTRIFDVDRLTVEQTDGTRLTRDIVVHPGAVVIVPVLDDGRIVMIRNHRITAGAELLELPAGTLEPGEPPIEAAARELEEETGYAPSHIEPFINFYASPGICTEIMYTFVATRLTLNHQRLEPGEQIQVEIFDPDDLRSALRDGTLRDAKSIATLAVFFLSQPRPSGSGQTSKNSDAQTPATHTPAGAPHR